MEGQGDFDNIFKHNLVGEAARSVYKSVITFLAQAENQPAQPTASAPHGKTSGM